MNYLTTQLENSILNIESIPKQALQTVTQKLPEIIKRTAAFNRNNSQITLNMMSLTMLNGQSHMRLIRQTLAEIENRQVALAESQVSHAKLLNEKSDPNADPEVQAAEERLRFFRISHLENKIAGAIKDIATLISAYERLVEKYDVKDWTETDFERSEIKHHVRRSFELLYRNMLERGTPSDSTMEYMQQFGIHAQLAIKEVVGYMTHVEELIKNGERPSSIHLEEFLDEMANKYEGNAYEVTKRMFGVEKIEISEYTNGW